MASKKDNPLAYETKNAWECLAPAQKARQAGELARRYIDFLTTCKTERETVEHVRGCLAAAGFSDDFRKNAVMRSLRGKCLFAARRGRTTLASGMRLVAAHGDAPRLDFKQHPFMEQAGVAQAKTHYYGGIRKYQWLARPLALHGVIALENGKSIRVTLGEEPGDPVFTIADLLPHLAQKQNTKTIADAFEGEKLNVILSHRPSPSAAKDAAVKEPLKDHLLSLVFERFGVREEDFISAEIEAVPAGPARFVGLDEGLVGGYGQDDRICVFSALEGLVTARSLAKGQTMAIMIWDREEIGSEGASGASSRFLQYCVEDLARFWAPDVLPSQILMNTRAISADVQAALDPDFQDLHDKMNAAVIGHGPCFSKFTGSRGKYGASEADAEFFAEMRGLLNRKDIPWQAAELGRVDAGGGGTVALFLAAYGMSVIDCGPALLSMHSPFELSSVADLAAMVELCRTFLES